MSVISVFVDFFLLFEAIMALSQPWLSWVLLVVFLLSILIMADLLPGNVSTIDPGGIPFWCPQVSHEGLTSHTRRCFFRPFHRWVRKPLRRVWWTARYLWYPDVRSYPCLFHRRVLRPYYKSRSHIIRQLYMVKSGVTFVWD